MINPDERTLLQLLDGRGPYTFEQLVDLSGLSPAQVVLAVDRLSRTGDVVLRKVGMEYHVLESVPI
ncbi:MAG: hypothetical protein ACREIM_08620 [Nitrospiraceae bacterium]